MAREFARVVKPAGYVALEVRGVEPGDFREMLRRSVRMALTRPFQLVRFWRSMMVVASRKVLGRPGGVTVDGLLPVSSFLDAFTAQGFHVSSIVPIDEGQHLPLSLWHPLRMYIFTKN